jgi:hypothetical protein
VLLGFITEQDPVLAMLESVAHHMMLIEAETKVGVGENNELVAASPFSFYDLPQ